MNARTVNISSLVILLALLSLICEGFLYYFLPSPIWSIVFAVLVSLALSHFFLESSFSYSYNVLHVCIYDDRSVHLCGNRILYPAESVVCTTAFIWYCSS